MGPDAAMVFAAGFGTRMGTLTQDRPKPLIHVAGRPLLDYALDLTRAMPLKTTVVNTHYKHQQIADHLAGRTDVKIIHETPEILDTGGGLKHALPRLNSDAVFTINTDTIWTGPNPLETLLQAWVPELMDALLILVPRQSAQGHRGNGDFNLTGAGTVIRRGQANSADFVFGGAQIIKTNGFSDIADDVFSMNLVWDKMLNHERVFGVIHTGGWVDVGTPHGILTAENELTKNQNV